VAVLCYDDPLLNVEAKNKEQAAMHDEIACDLHELDPLQKQITEYEEEEDEEEGVDLNVNVFDMDRRDALKGFIEKMDSMAEESRDHVYKCLCDSQMDLETLSTCRGEEGDHVLKMCGITAIGARRRLLKVIEGMPHRWKPSFYAYQTTECFFISWPDTIASDTRRRQIEKLKEEDENGLNDNPFIRMHRRKCSENIFKVLTRFAETRHFELIKERANLRYHGDGDGTYKCFMWGVGMHGRLGHGYGLSYAAPNLLSSLGTTQIPFMRIACGAQHTIGCTFDGSVLTWGNGQYGQLGNGEFPEDYKGVGINVAYTPQQVAQLKSYFVVGVAAGRWHSMVLITDRSVWVWGDNKFGQLGLDNYETQGVPRRIFALDSRQPCSVHAGSWHSGAVTESGKLFLWGKNAFGQLGDGTVRGRTHPKLNQVLREIGKVRTCALGGDHTLVVMVDNLVYSFGRGDKGQLGLPKIDDYHPEKLRDQSEGGQKSTYKIQTVPAEIVDLTNSNVCQVLNPEPYALNPHAHVRALECGVAHPTPLPTPPETSMQIPARHPPKPLTPRDTG
jgi:hypothetical protein